MRGFEADDCLRMFPGHLSRALRVHVFGVLFDLAAAHPITDDVDEGEDAGLGAVNHALLEVLEIAPARSARVDHRRRATAEAVPVGVDAQVARIGAPARARIDVDVNVDEARRDIQAVEVDHLRGGRRGDVLFDGGDQAFRDRHVPRLVDVVLRIDDVAVFQQQIVFRLSRLNQRRNYGEKYRNRDSHLVFSCPTSPRWRNPERENQTLMRPWYCTSFVLSRRAELLWRVL